MEDEEEEPHLKHTRVHDHSTPATMIAVAKNSTMAVASSSSPPVVKKKKWGGVHLWMRMDRWGQSELVEWDKSVIMKRASIPARDLRILGPIFSPSFTILAREKAMIVNLEYIRAIVTAEEVLLLDPLRHEVLPFVDQLRRKLPRKSPSEHELQSAAEVVESLEDELPFEFQVLEIALEVVCRYLESSVAELERDAYPALDELAIRVSTNNLEYVRSLKSNLTQLLVRVQKVRDEIEHLLEDNDDMAQLYLTRKWIQNQQLESMSGDMAPDVTVPTAHHLCRFSSTRIIGSLVSNYLNHYDVDALEMLLEAYFAQLDGTRNKILSVREYINDTEDYVNILLNSRRNELMQLHLVLTTGSFSIVVEVLVIGLLSLNIPCAFYHVNGVFSRVVGCLTAGSLLIFLLIIGYARWKKVLGT